ncbi:Na+/H+ antiporter [Rugosimonospora africana]|uniref:Na+/H+ antiporter n=1 Tax=Rugosimonospora africana TaxID=556532 RepID=A0A8J3VRM7_9ACTN|nr:Na+/H+ antiporter [Rugosimonospora africana]GIH15553.1 Na+/H+ antiporter [Rugosimonospora africana]
MRGVEIILLLVVLATAVAASARRLRVPAPSLLVVAGLVVAFVPGVPAIQLSPGLVGLVVLPPLLYAAGQDLSWRELRPVWRPVTVLVIGLVIASAAAVGVVASAVAGLPASMAFVLGAVLASTDPVAVTALGRRLSLPGRLQALIQAESLFNDATSLVLVRVAVTAAVAGGAVSWYRGVGQFALLAGGGVLIGAAVAGGVALIRRRTEDPVLETVIALVTPYAGYVIAEAVHVSGVTAVVVTSVILAGQATRLTSARIRLQLHAVYDTVVFLLESVVFSLIGLELPGLVRAAGGRTGTWLVQALAITVTLLAVRALWVFPLSLAAQSRRGGRPSWRVPAVVSWAGARGVLPLAAALSIPLTARHGAPLAGRDHVLLLTTAVIVTTLVVQGFTLGPLVRRSGVALPEDHARNETATARTAMSRAALTYLDEVEDQEAAPQVMIAQLRQIQRSRLDSLEGRSDDSLRPAMRQLRRDLIAVESAVLTRLYEEGTVGAETRRRLQRRLDLEETSLTE